MTVKATNITTLQWLKKGSFIYLLTHSLTLVKCSFDDMLSAWQCYMQISSTTINTTKTLKTSLLFSISRIFLRNFDNYSGHTYCYDSENFSYVA